MSAMAGGANPGDDLRPDGLGPERPSDEALLVAHATALADGVEAALPGWVDRAVTFIATAWFGAVPGDVHEAARAAGARAALEVGPAVRAALLADVDDRGPNPLAVLRDAVRFPTAVLRDAGVPPVERDAFVEGRFPEYDYDLVPTAFADLDPRLHDLGLAWGAARAFVHRSRHRGARPDGPVQP
jgi:hypothetical protein